MNAAADAVTELKPLLAEIAAGRPLEHGEARQAFSLIMSGEASPVQIGGLLTALRLRGETITEITAAAEVMRERMVPVSITGDAIDIVGTGGDGFGTYNISTATAIVVAACGVKVAKHGNRALSSKSGAGDVLSELGLKLDLAPEAISRCIEEAGIGFMFAPNHHPGVAAVGPARRDLGFRTIFNVLGPLCNPAGVKRTMLGVYHRSLVRPVAEVLKNLGMTSALVIHGADGLDEISLTTHTYAARLNDGEVSEYEINPEEIGQPRVPMRQLIGGTPAENAVALREVLDGKAGAYRNIVLLNAAASLQVAGRCDALHDGAAMAAQAIDSGEAKRVLEKLVTVSNRT